MNTQHLDIKSALAQAKKLTKSGLFSEAVSVYHNILQQQPYNSLAKKGLQKLQQKISSNHLEPTQMQKNELISLFNSGKIVEAENFCKQLLVSFPTSLIILNIYGATQNAQENFKEAIQVFTQMIQLNPHDSACYYNLGVAYHGLGDFENAVLSYKKASQLKPDFVNAFYNLANTFLAMGEHEKAVENYDKTISLNPSYADAYINNGCALRELKKYSNALENYNKALEINPDSVVAYNNKCVVLQEMKQYEDALICIEQSLRLNSNIAETHYHHAVVLQQLWRLPESVQSYNIAIQLNPHYIDAFVNKGNALLELGQYEESIKSYKKAIELAPDFAVAYNNCANAFKSLGDNNEAMKYYNAAIELMPSYAEAYMNRGVVFQELLLLDESQKNYRKAIQLDPEYAEAYNNMGTGYKLAGKMDEAIKSYNKAIQLKPDYIPAYSNLLFSQNCMTSFLVQDAIKPALKFGELVSKKVKKYFNTYAEFDKADRLKIGFVSGDLRNHPVGYFVENILHFFNKDKFELFAYPTVATSDALTLRVQPCFSAWKHIHYLNDEAAAKLIYDDGINILIDLSGHTAHNRLSLFAWKPAPIQVSWLGYFATTGVKEIDYIFGDPYLTPKAEDTNFIEKVWRLPETRLCFTPPRINISISELPALKNGFITFGCFNNLFKVNKDVICLWAEILKAVSNSRLFLKAKQFNDNTAVEKIHQYFSDYGIDKNRIILEGSESRELYFRAYHKVDIALDPFPFPGGTTTVEGLWMGVPVISLTGDRMIFRQGEGILMNAGLGDWVAYNKDEYLAKVISFSSDIKKLMTIRRQLREQVLASPLFDGKRFTINFEKALSKMWVSYLSR